MWAALCTWAQVELFGLPISPIRVRPIHVPMGGARYMCLLEPWAASPPHCCPLSLPLLSLGPFLPQTVTGTRPYLWQAPFKHHGYSRPSTTVAARHCQILPDSDLVPSSFLKMMSSCPPILHFAASALFWFVICDPVLLWLCCCSFASCFIAPVALLAIKFHKNLLL